MDLEKLAWRRLAPVPLRLLSVGAVVAVLVAGCGGSSTPTTTTKKHTSTKVSTGQPKTSSSSSPTFASVQNCSSLTGVGEQFAKAMSSATSGGKFNLNQMVSAYNNLANAAPSAIRPDIQVLAGAFSTYASALAKAGYKFGSVPSTSQITAIESATKAFDSAKLKAATKNLEAWATANCK